MMYETWLNTDLKKLNKVVHLKGNLFSQDNMSNLVGVHVFDDGEAVGTIGGTITGWILRDDGGSVMVTGETSGGDAWIVLPEEAYAVPGPVTITIRHTASSESGAARTALAVCTAYVYRTVSDTMVDPGDVLPSLEEIMARVQALETRVTEAMSSISTAVSAAQTARNEAAAAANSLRGATASASTLPAGSSATAVLTQTEGVFTFTFGIPKGDKGDPGNTGPANTITSTKYYYAESASGSTIPSSGWVENFPPTVTQGNYLWSRTDVTYATGTTVSIYSVTRYGVDGLGSIGVEGTDLVITI